MAFEGFYCFGPGMWKLFVNEAGLYVGWLSTCHHVTFRWCWTVWATPGWVLSCCRAWCWYCIWQCLLALIVLHDLQYRSRRPLMPAGLLVQFGWIHQLVPCYLNSTSHWHVQLCCCIKALQCDCWVKHPVGLSALLYHLYVPHIMWTEVEFWCKLLVCWILYCVLAAEVFKF